MLTRSSTGILEPCQGYDYATELTFMPNASDSRLLGTSLPINVKYALENEPTTANYHNFCMRPKNFSADPILSTFYKMLTISPDLEGQTFVSTIESKYYLSYNSLLIICNNVSKNNMFIHVAITVRR
ncbi:unnamed protein product [Rotaria sp. Silwood1]|nr:unnamed protein product [Rotaria sp. Silwood1]